jgi:hypothetical protein
MKINSLLCAAALAARVVSSMAQSNTYSLNVVGYVDVPYTGSGNFNLVCNPLMNANNDITNLFRGFAQDGDQVYRWNPTIQDLDPTVPTYSAFSQTWTPHFVLLPGEGVFYLNASVNKTTTFIGDVIQGSYTSPHAFSSKAILGNGNFNCLGSPIPIGFSFTNCLPGITPQDGDQVYFWNTAIQDLDATVPSYSAFSQLWNPSTRVINPGIGFFYLGAGADQTTWVRNYTVP